MHSLTRKFDLLSILPSLLCLNQNSWHYLQWIIMSESTEMTVSHLWAHKQNTWLLLGQGQTLQYQSQWHLRIARRSFGCHPETRWDTDTVRSIIQLSNPAHIGDREALWHFDIAFCQLDLCVVFCPWWPPDAVNLFWAFGYLNLIFSLWSFSFQGLRAICKLVLD